MTFSSDDGAAERFQSIWGEYEKRPGAKVLTPGLSPLERVGAFSQLLTRYVDTALETITLRWIEATERQEWCRRWVSTHKCVAEIIDTIGQVDRAVVVRVRRVHTRRGGSLAEEVADDEDSVADVDQ